MTIAIFLGSLLAAMMLGVPIAFSLLACGAALMWHLNLFDPQILAQNLIEGSNSFPLLAVPFFMLAGEIMNAGGLSKRIVDMAGAFVGHLRGGLGLRWQIRRERDGLAIGAHFVSLRINRDLRHRVVPLQVFLADFAAAFHGDYLLRQAVGFTDVRLFRELAHERDARRARRRAHTETARRRRREVVLVRRAAAVVVDAVAGRIRACSRTRRARRSGSRRCRWVRASRSS